MWQLEKIPFSSPKSGIGEAVAEPYWRVGVISKNSN
jgi:hypothetical protein